MGFLASTAGHVEATHHTAARMIRLNTVSEHFCPLLRNCQYLPILLRIKSKSYNVLRSLYSHSIISLRDLHYSHVIPLTCQGQPSLRPFTCAVPHAWDNFCPCICLAWFLSFWNILLKVHLFIETSPESPAFPFTLPSFIFLHKNVFLYSIDKVLLIYFGISLYPHENVSPIRVRNFLSFVPFLSSVARKVSGTQKSLLNIEWINALPPAISWLRKYMVKRFFKNTIMPLNGFSL